MPVLEIANLYHKKIKINDTSISILRNIQLAGQDWMFACGAKGRCTTCRAKIISGIENISDYSEAEIKFKKEKKLKDDERLMCQCLLIKDNIIVLIPDDCKLPHLLYNDN